MTEKREYLNLYSTIKNFNDEFLSDSPEFPLNDIGPIKELNIFVGANNSRKTSASLRQNQPLLSIATELLELQEAEKNVKIHTGENLFNDVLEYRNSDRKNRKKFEAFQKFIGDQFFDGKEVEIVAREGKVSWQDLLNGPENEQTNIKSLIESLYNFIKESNPK
ncbi:MAG: hypothetical protein ACQETH_11645, partial [Candidatus Rifleibacteriota bacterium]